jgi:predicted permease
MLRDLRHAVRLLVQAKGWTAVVVLSLALGIGANTALFSAANGLLLKTVPVRDPQSLVRLRWYGRNQMSNNSSDYGFTGKTASGQNIRTTVSYAMYQEYVANNQTMQDLTACAPFGRVNLVVDGHAEIATSFISTGNYYRLLGVTATLGRTIMSDDDKPGAPPVALISHRYWRSRFGSDSSVIGKTVQMNNVPVTIVGVLSPDYIGIQQTVAEPPDISVALAMEPQLQIGNAVSRLSLPTTWWLQVMGRLKPGVTPEQVQANLATVFQHTARAGMDAYLAGLTPEVRARSTNQNRTAVPTFMADSGKRGIYDVNTNDLRAVTILTVVVALVLLIVCANVANLLLSRATARQKEISVRLSLGATRGRLVRQLLTESLLLAALGGALGILVGYWGQQLLPGAAGQATPFDWRVAAFLVAVTGATGILFGIAPALRATQINVSSALKETSRSVAGARSLLTKTLLVVQVAVSLVLLIGAGLFLRTLSNLRQVDVGFNPNNIVLFRINPSLNRYDQPRQVALYRQLEERLSGVSGVRSVAWSNPALLSGSVNSTNFVVKGHAYSRDVINSINRLVVSSGFFTTMEMPVVVGRSFTPRDDASAPFVALINETAARTYFARHENPIGMRFGSNPEESGKLEIVGILRDAKYDSVRDEIPPTMYVPFAQNPQGGMVFEIRTAGEPMSILGAIREAVRQVDPNLPMQDVSTQMEQFEKRFLQEKLFAQAYALFGGLALLLAAVGLFGLMSYNVARRTNEIGIRMALGAQRGDVVRMVISESMWLVGIGAAVGLAAAFAAGRLVATLLFGLAPTDVITMMTALVTMLAVSALAGYLPARRAARVDPIVALHYE